MVDAFGVLFGSIEEEERWLSHILAKYKIAYGQEDKGEYAKSLKARNELYSFIYFYNASYAFKKTQARINSNVRAIDLLKVQIESLTDAENCRINGLINAASIVEVSPT